MALSTGQVVRTVLLSLWGMATLVLLFAVAFLVYEMMQRGEDPLEITAFQAPVPPDETETTTPMTAREVNLYFASPDGAGLAAERRRIDFKDNTIANCRQTLEALIEGPRERLAPVMAPATQIRGMYLLESGELAVDFSRDLEANHVPSPSAEMLMVRAIVATLTQASLTGRENQSVRKVRFLFEGAPPQEGFPVHYDLSDPIAPDRAWVEREPTRAGDG